MHICFIDGKSYPGEVKHSAEKALEAADAERQTQGGSAHGR